MKVAVITGAARGIGRAIALRLAKDGISVAVSDILTEQVKETAEIVRKNGGKALPLAIDVRDEEQIKSMFERVVDEFGGVDILVNNAGIVHRSHIVDTTSDDFDFVIGVNLKGAFLCIKHAAPIMRRRGGGVIVNISSLHAFATLPNLAVYASSKAGLVGLTKAAALDLGDWNIRVVAICPAAVDTPMLRDKPTEEENIAAANRWKKASPIGLLLQPEDVANLVAWLVSDEARGLTGVAVVLDAGVSADLQVRKIPV
ncbi:MAG: SDR family oxidoreductase [Armatimonadetes bacterium]|nr:SDR family oxidoreductase [Armatimonadota bacterium]MCX7969361.1 SDR family oxidoreductase [Armatimonadota bacterium]MDW8142893.1 SDR family oxidoreductase [Armatimonadota bacterium]